MTITEAIARCMLALRKRRGWTAQQLAEEMARAGVPWDRQVVSKLENGRRQTVSVEELLTLAYVLDVAPVDLVVPKELTNEAYQVTPTISVPADTVREWIRGETVLTKPEPGQIGNAMISVSTTAAQILRFVESMPDERGKEVMRRLLMAEQREWQREEVRAAREADGDAGR